LQIMSALNVSESSRGLSIGVGGSSKALRENETNIAKADLNSIKLMGLSNSRKFRIGASQSRLSGKASVLSGLASAGGEYGTYRERTKKIRI